MIKIGNIELPDMPLLLAPMEDVSDPPFRHLCKKYGADMLYTEFISADGLIRDADKSMKKLDIYPDERPVGIQIFGGDEEAMVRSAAIVEEAKPEVLDINYGCPVKNVVCRNAGSGILRDIDKMVALTAAIVKGTKLPVTVKTRLGWDENSINIDEVAERLQDIGVQALSIHGRTRAQLYKGEANWSHIARVKNNPRITIPIFGNGDITSVEKALEYKNRYDVDGIMIGRAAIGYPWFFNEVKHFFATGTHLPKPTIEDRVEAARNHLQWAMDWKGQHLGIIETRRHYTNYFKGLPNFKEYRMKMVSSENPEYIFQVFDDVLQKFSDLEMV